MFRTIVMAADGSPAVERLIIYTEHLARRNDAQVVIVHAYELPQGYEWTEAYDKLRQQYETVAQEVVDDAVDALAKVGVRATGDLRQGSAATAILEAVRVHQADLVVMGGRAQKRAPVAEALLGSVSSAVLRQTYCPVLIVP